MMPPYNSWDTPPTTSTMQTELVSEEFAPDYLKPEGNSDLLTQALATVQQQSVTINKLLDMLGSKK